MEENKEIISHINTLKETIKAGFENVESDIRELKESINQVEKSRQVDHDAIIKIEGEQARCKHDFDSFKEAEQDHGKSFSSALTSYKDKVEILENKFSEHSVIQDKFTGRLIGIAVGIGIVASALTFVIGTYKKGKFILNPKDKIELINEIKKQIKR